MDIRTATPDDVDDIAALEAECFPEAEAATREQIARRIERYGGHFWLAFDGGRLVAYVNGPVTDELDLADRMYEDASMHDEDGKWQMIFGVATAPDHRGRGLASELIGRAIADVRAQGRAGLVLTCKDALVGYYTRFGFADEGTSDSRHGGVTWHQMRLAFRPADAERGRPSAEPASTLAIRDIREGDWDAVLRMNEADVAVLSPLDRDSLERMAGCAEVFWVAEDEDAVAGFMVAMREGCGYWSENYRWFDDESPERFYYVDRIVVDAAHRGKGIARTFYQKLIELAREQGVPAICAEIETEPVYNEPSLRFHASFGFQEVGAKPYGEGVTVSLQALELD